MAVIWGIPYLLIKIAVGELTPVTLVFLRTALGAALLLPIAAARGGLRPLFPYWRWVLAYTVVEVSLPWFLLSDAERGLSSSLTGLLIAAVPLIGAVVTWLTRGDDRLDLRRIGGLVIGLIGVAALVGLNVRSAIWERSARSAWSPSAMRRVRSSSLAVCLISPRSVSSRPR